LKCDELGKRRQEKFVPESPRVIVCEGFHEAKLVCRLLKRLNLTNCDVTFPKAKEGKDGIAEVVGLLCANPGFNIDGIAVIRDADKDPDKALEAACEGFAAPFEPPSKAFSIERKKQRSSAIFLMPGKGKTGTLEHLLFDVVAATHKDLADNVSSFEALSPRMAEWEENQKAKMRMQCAVAAFCEKNPQCSLAYIWSTEEDNPLDIDSPIFQELRDFLTAFAS